MKVLFYINKLKDENNSWREKLIEVFAKHNLSALEIFDCDLSKDMSADAIFVFGGDGTILKLVPFVSKNNIPVIGINAGNIGFLTEFEIGELDLAVELFVNNKLKKDYRLSVEATLNNETFISLNDIVVQRTFEINSRASVTSLVFGIDGKEIDKVIGDGIVVSTPTGTTAYSMSAGGSILAPGINALSMTPISSRSLHHRPIIFSADQSSSITYVGGSETGLFIDGKFVAMLSEYDQVIIKKHNQATLFLRKDEFNFYDKLLLKLNR